MNPDWLWDIFLVLLGAFGAVSMLYFGIVRGQGRIEAKVDAFAAVVNLLQQEKLDISLVNHKVDSNSARIAQQETRLSRAEVEIQHFTGSQ